jgi:exopolysaccharide biosynthesis polyprenyl glycosylphosphotransferase
MINNVATLESCSWPALATEAAALIRWRDLLRSLVVVSAIVLDGGFLAIAGFTATAFRFSGLGPGNTIDLIAATGPAFFLAGAALGAYRQHILSSASCSVRRALAALSIAAILGLTAAFAFKATANYSRLETGYMFLLAVVCLPLGRTFVAFLIRNRLQSTLAPNLVILGDREAIGRFKAAGTTVIDVDRWGLVPASNEQSFLERVYSMIRHADRVLLTFSDVEARKAWAEAMRLTGVNAEVVEPRLKDMVPLGIGGWNGSPTLIISRGPLMVGERILKRFFDLGLTVLAAPLIVPIVAICGLLVKLESPGPVFFTQLRIGQNNRRYRCYKLRTMWSDKADPTGKQSTLRDDERITRIGQFLRKTSIDELPQLFNVLKGEMSLVGPRPHALGSRAAGSLFWEAVPRYWCRHAMKPGLTGLAQVRGFRGATHTKDDVVKRVAADLEYINSWSVWLDVKILIQTMQVLIHPNAY